MEEILALLGLESLKPWLMSLGWGLVLLIGLPVLALLLLVILVVVLIVKSARSPRPAAGAGPVAPVAAAPAPAPRPARVAQPARQARPARAPRGAGTARWGLRVLQGGASTGQVYPLEGEALAGRGDIDEGPYPGYAEDGGRWTRFIRLEMEDRPALAKQCSRKHFRIRERRGMDGVFTVSVANHSGNPVWVDGKMLQAEGETAEVKEGSVVELPPDWKLQVCRMG